jgi:hypothetical protein
MSQAGGLSLKRSGPWLAAGSDEIIAIAGPAHHNSRGALILFFTQRFRCPACQGVAPMKFPLGEVYVTPRAHEVLNACGRRPEELLARHQAGDWGDVSPEERQLNEEALHQSISLISNYNVETGHRLTVFTRADRTCTFVHVVHGDAHRPSDRGAAWRGDDPLA